ncbi:MAG: DUF4079 family protein [Deltaproteobacteria bacterium]|nr:MAG: DUF4079 family protein [Deltaproteobacteria bacterium]
MRPGSLEFYLAYVHPIFGGIVLLIGGRTLSLGLRLRRHREGRSSLPISRAETKARHKRSGILFVLLYTVSFLIGPLSQAFLRGERVFRSPHGYFALISFLLVLCGAGFARKMLLSQTLDPEVRTTHAFCFTLALFFATGIVIMGYTLLP